MNVQTPQAAIQTASTWRRFFDVLIDTFFFYLAAVVVGMVLGILGLSRYLNENDLIAYVFAYGLYFCYYFFFEAAFQRTPGKFITGTKVVTSDGLMPSTRAIALRTLSRLVPFEPISYYTGKDEAQKRTWWHDRWTGTRVVKA